MSNEPQIRMTPQRQVILDKVRQTGRHATADEVFHMVRKSLPRISLGTVYRNLEMLSRLGLVRKMGHVGGQRRYEGNLEPHYHVRCLLCDRIQDVPFVPLDGLGEAEKQIEGFEIHGYDLEFLGICQECRAAESDP